MKLEDVSPYSGLKLILGPGIPFPGVGAVPASLFRLISAAHLVAQDGQVVKALKEDHRPIEAHDLEDAYVVEKVGEDEYEVYPPLA
jgi:hypothetical protein